MSSEQQGINRFQGCLFIFLTVFGTFMIVPFVMGLFSLKLGASALLSTIPVMYIIIVNVYTLLLVGREKQQSSIEASERLRTFEYFRPSGGRLFLWALLGGALGALIGRKVYKYQMEDKTFKLGLFLLLFLNFCFYSFAFTLIVQAGNHFDAMDEQEKKHEQWANSNEVADSLVKTINTYAKQKEEAVNKRNPSLIEDVDWESFSMNTLTLKIENADPELKLKLKYTKIYLDGKVNTSFDGSEEMQVVVEINYDVRDPSGNFDAASMRCLNLIYDKDKKKWIIKDDEPYYGYEGAKPEGEPVVTNFN